MDDVETVVGIFRQVAGVAGREADPGIGLAAEIAFGIDAMDGEFRPVEIAAIFVPIGAAAADIQNPAEISKLSKH